MSRQASWCNVWIKRWKCDSYTVLFFPSSATDTYILQYCMLSGQWTGSIHVFLACKSSCQASSSFLIILLSVLAIRIGVDASGYILITPVRRKLIWIIHRNQDQELPNFQNNIMWQSMFWVPPQASSRSGNVWQCYCTFATRFGPYNKPVVGKANSKAAVDARYAQLQEGGGSEWAIPPSQS